MTVLLFLLLTALQPVPASSEQAEAERLFALGTELFAEGDFRGAVAAYEGALETGWTSAALELNLGNAYAEAGRLGYAVLHFERVLRLDARDEAARHNLGVVHRRIGAEAATAPLSPLEATARWLAGRVGPGPLAGLAFALYLAVLGLVGAWAWRRVLPPWQRRALVVLVPLALLVGGAAVLTARYEATPRAVVVADAAALHTAPAPEATSAGTAPEGTVLTVTGRRAGWSEVRLPDGTTGWAPASMIVEI